MSDVSEEVIKAYKTARKWQSIAPPNPDVLGFYAANREVYLRLADALRDERAARLKAEFLVRVWQDTFVHDNKPGNLCECRWTFPDWQALAHKQLMGEK